MFGRKPRTKSPAQIQAELSAVLATGYRGDIFFVDDNFIGNKKKTQEILEAIRAWNEAHQEPFEYTTEASVDLAQKPRLLQAMVDAKFRRVFLGIESPSAASLEETKKYQNLRASIEESVLTIASAGVNVMAG
ncbi:MAG TPA: B12-binding domain-containing radical SAM protein, partial [Planctomycetes bacterium]|nr:B12-binding domain-containing radical SAM protein [Planctomycetota bacterium]